MTNIPKVILWIESSRASGRELLCGIANYAHHHGPWQFYWEPGGLEEGSQMLRNVEADGIILRDTGKLEEALDCGIPAVVIGHRKSEVPGVVNVITDSDTIGRMAAEHLLSCGFKHFAYCGYARTEYENTAWSGLRKISFQRRLDQAGMTVVSHYEISRAGHDRGDELRALADWLHTLPKPIGIMACNDECSQRVMEACKAAGLAVPDVAGVIGADNDEIVCGLTNPPLSSVAIDFQRAGYEAAHALSGLMRGYDGISRRILATATQVVARRSTDFVAADEPHLGKALRFIRDNARTSISVDDVARNSGVSRRSLEKRFRAAIGRSILEEIRRVRTDQIARLLVETDLPINEIAELGFAEVQHFSRYFRSIKQVSPSEYRKRFRDTAAREA
ncbi:MAG TPA: DNA-binding transcriptional regulator [Verrucomicrobiae bacterium]|nr:DNA-binding transcriptional regulator [Verrucomicrobiae bacterium]